MLRRGSITTLRVLAIRRDEFNSDIGLTVTGLPPKVTTHRVTLRSGAAEILLVFTVAEDAPAWHDPIQVLGRAKIGDAKVVRQAHGGTIVWDGATTRLMPDFALAVTEETVPVAIRMTEDKQWEVPREGKLSIPFRIDQHGDLKEHLELKPLALPGGHKSGRDNCRRHEWGKLGFGSHRIGPNGRLQIVIKRPAQSLLPEKS